MSHLDPVTVATPQRSQQEMLKDHNQILQNYFDTYITRGLSQRTIDGACWFIQRWFEKIRVRDESGEHQLYIWEAMKPFEGRQRIKEFLLTLSAVDDDNKVCLRPTTVRAYATQLERLFISTLESPFIEGLQTISSRYGPIENPFTGVEYPLHSRDILRAERFFLTPEQILELLVFLREVYPGLTNRDSTVGRLYTIVMLITETGMRSIEILNLDALGDDRDIFYNKRVIQTRYGKGCNSSGPQTRLMPLTDPALITLMQYEREVRLRFRNHLVDPALFLTLRGERLSYSTLQDTFSRFIEVARKAGVNLPPKLTLHDLRASFATNYIEANPNQLWELMELLGHVSPSSTCLYIRSRGKTRLLSMKQARGPRPGRTGFSAMVYNR
ncbi:MAG TPA: tyrosine-type recombinase/integrase [Pyrinomonadaceae bacterium]|nr:tyrosine-type recombinase/integrase [Pyrinomonadaceae bacterium]